MCNTQREERIVTELKIYGDHDERTVSQMWRCMGVGSVAGGVLCATATSAMRSRSAA
jgi:hypothetical protein